MPKVTKEYVDKKKSEIIEAAKEVFRNKPLYEISMLDIIRQAGLSKGGIYRYFKDIDDVIIELINGESDKCNYKNNISKIINNSTNRESIIVGLLELLGRHIDENIYTLGKIQFDLTILQSSNPERAQVMLNKLTEYTQGKYLIDTLYKQIEDGIKDGEFIPDIKLQEILNYIRVHIEGTVKMTVFEKCYQKIEGDAIKEDIKAETMMGMLSRTIMNMLRGKY